MVTRSTAGALLVAAPPLSDPNFDRTVVYMLEHRDGGALGVVLNRPTDEDIPDVLRPWKGHLSEPRVLFAGGPVETTAVIGVGQIGVDLQTVDLSQDASADVAEVRLFRGYSGWGPGQLDREVEVGAWLIVRADATDVFNPDPTALWRDVLRRQGGRLSWLAEAPDDLTLN